MWHETYTEAHARAPKVTEVSRQRTRRSGTISSVKYAIAIVLAAACSAQLGDAIGSHNVGVDSSTDGAIPPDAMPDARGCTGGDAHAMDTAGNCFLFFAGPKNYAQAKAACTAENAHLVKIENAAQNTIVANLSLGNDSFLGATDAVTEGTFLWDDGTPVVFKMFHTGEPNNSGSAGYQEDCIVLAGKRTPADTWDDRPCAVGIGPAPSGSYAYVCEY